MSNDSARRPNHDPEIEISEIDEDSQTGDRTPKAPAMQRLGRYRIVCELASGGMATVNLAIADGLDKLLALKVIHPHLAQEENFLRMFLDEARIASSVSHRNVCNVFDYGEQDGRYYMAMDYLAGGTLRDVVRRIRAKRAKLGAEAVSVYMAYIIAQACEGLHAAHELRDPQGDLMDVVHRDVSPHNLFVTYDGNVSVVDFGIARASDRLQQTATGILKGKFSYMAPEQIRQVSVDRRADIWALGVCLWEALTQKRLFVRASQADTLLSVMTDTIKLPSEVDPSLPAALDAIVARALSRNLDERYATAREMGRELMGFCRKQGANIGTVEIEQFMQELFPQERIKSQELVRRAKRTAANELDHSQSLSMPFITQSGAMLRTGMRRGATGATPVSAVGYTGHTGSAAAPQTEARDTSLPVQRRGRSSGFLWGVGSAVLLGSAAFFAMPRQAVHVAVPEARSEEPIARPLDEPSPRPGATIAQPALPPVAALEPAPAAPEPPVPAPQQMETAPSPRAAPSPRYAAQRNGQRGRSVSQPSEAVAAEASVRSESRPQLEVDASADRPEPVAPPEPKAVEPVAPAPVPVAAQPAPVATPKPSLPKPDTRPLDANPAFAGVSAQGSLGTSVVNRMLARSTGLMRACYQTAARAAGRNDFAPVAISLTIDEAGLVHNPKAGAHALPGLSACITDGLKRVRSDQKPDVGVVKVEAQVSFRPL
jgi:eukaryotic-like serine/threonine-protein kinase